jgi:F0F1-type ATP synthase assembly protein I
MVGSTKNKDKQQGKAQGYMKYSGMAFQMAAYIIVGLFLGKQLDKYLGTERPVFSALGAILFLIAYFIKLVIDLNKNKP